MNVAYDKLILDLEMKISRFDRIQQVNKVLDKTNIKLNRAGRMIDANSGRFVAQATAIKKMSAASAQLNRRFDMNNLSFLFTGMQLMMLGNMIQRFMIPSMKRLEELNTAGAKKVIGLSAAFEFLKVSIFETLSNTGLFDNFITFLMDAIIKISEFTQKHPELLLIVGAIGLIATALGALSIARAFLGQLEYVAFLVSSKTGMMNGTASIGAGISRIQGLLKTGFTMYLAYEGIKDFSEGGITASLDEFLALGLTWFAGLGWGVAFYLVMKGIEHITGKPIEQIIGEKVKGWQDKLSMDVTYFPEDTFKPTKRLEFLEGTALGSGLDWIYDGIKNIGEAWDNIFTSHKEKRLEDLRDRTKELEERIASGEFSLSKGLAEVKDNMDAIPDEQTKTITFKAKYEGFKSNDEIGSDEEVTGSLT